ncbi:MAG: helicase HerA domain-containing protein [Streptosporangiaceae bacterium]
MEKDIAVPPKRRAAVQVTVGPALSWDKAGWGTFSQEAQHTFATWEVASIAGSGEIDTASSATITEAMYQAALGILSGAALMPGCDALELRYVAVPGAGGRARIRMLVTAKTLGRFPVIAEAAVEAACAALPRGFEWGASQADARTDDPTRNLTVIELRRHEEVTIPQWDYVPTDFYYTINDEPGDGSGWSRFWSVLSQVGRPASVSLLFRGTELDWDERNALAGITSDLQVVAFPHTDFDVLGQQVNYPADTNAALALESWTQRIVKLQRPVLARLAVRANAETGIPVAAALATAVAASSDAAVSHPMYVEAPRSERDARQAAYGFDTLEILPWGGHPIWEADEAPHVLRRLPYLFGVGEAAGLAVLPVPDAQGVPGFARARYADVRRSATMDDEPDEAGLRLGRILHHGQPAGQLVLPLAAVNRHVLVVGAPGSGKTTSVLTLLAELWRSYRVPFLVIEPTKTEYRTLFATPGLDELQVFCLGRDDISPLRLNPLAPPPGVRCEVHANSVMAALKMALPLPPPLPQLLEEALERTYQVSGWTDSTTIGDGIAPPTLRQLLDSFDAVFEQQGYIGEARNIASAVRVRLRSLLRGSRGKMLDTVESADFADLMTRPVVVELDDIADADDKAVLSAFLLDRIRAAARARGSTGGRLVHVTVIEEAHRLLARASSAARISADGDDARAEAVRAFCEAIAELRALGEGFVLSSQSPSALAEAAVANTGTRILHRLESFADRESVLNDLGAGPLDREVSARLNQGEALIRWPDRDEAELIRVTATPGIDSSRRVSGDDVGRRMLERARVIRSLLPYPLCTRTVCSAGCEPSVRAEGSRVAAGVRPAAREVWHESNGMVRALGPIASMLVRQTRGEHQIAYCAAAHLAAANDAFNVPRRVDIRPQLATAIKEASDNAQ